MTQRRKARRIVPKALERATVSVPGAFDFDSVFGSVSGTANRETLKNASYFILDALSRHKFSLRHLEKIEIEGYYNLSSKLLKRICGNSYSSVLDTLKTAGIIEMSAEGYQPGVKSRGYRLSQAMDQSELVYKELSGNIRSQYQKYSAERRKDDSDSLTSLAHLTKWFDSQELTIDVIEANKFIELGNLKIQALIASSGLSPEGKAVVRGRAALRLTHQINSVSEFGRGEFRLHNKGRDERLHSLLTNMKRELRSFIQYQGQPLVSLDIRSSQPYFFTMMLKKGFYSLSSKNPLGWKSLVGTLLVQKHPPEAPTTLPTPGTPLATLTSPQLMSIMFPGCSHCTDKQVFDQTRFLQISWAEGIYGLLVEEFSVSGGGVQSIEAMKKLVMWLFFEYRPYKYMVSRFKDFEALYPIEAGVIHGANQLQGNFLPLLLQRLESRIMLHRVSKVIAEKLPDAVLLAVHDCLLTTPDFAPEVEMLMRAELTEITGLAPGIKIETKSSGTELDGLSDFAQKIYNDSLKAVKKSKGSLAYASYKLIPPLLNEHVKHGTTSSFFNPFFYGRYEVPDNPAPDEVEWEDEDY